MSLLTWIDIPKAKLELRAADQTEGLLLRLKSPYKFDKYIQVLLDRFAT